MGSTNYSDWSTRVKLLLQDKDCWDGIIVDPVDITGLDAHALKDLTKRQVKAMALMSQTVTSLIMSSIRKFEGDPKGFWDYQQERYQPQATQRKLMLLNKLSVVRMGTSSVETYLREIDDVVSQLSSVGHTVNETELIHTVLMGLPYNWGPFVSNFGSELSRTPPPSYGNFVSRMQTEELWRVGKAKEVEEEAMFTSRFNY